MFSSAVVEPAPEPNWNSEAVTRRPRQSRAARCDGRLDRDELASICDFEEELDPGGEEAIVLAAELARTTSVEELEAAATSPERAVQIYVASRLAIDVDTLAERIWLEVLGIRLGLDEELTRIVCARLDAS